jgi:colanic acid/amylovoran biosynthesis glycosyltransferase
MKIAYVLAEFPSPTETFIAREIAALRREGFEIDVWALKAGVGARFIPVILGARLMGQLRGRDQRYWQGVGKGWAQRENKALAGIQLIHAAWASFPADIAIGAARELGVPWSFFGHARDLWVEGEHLGEKLRTARFAATCTRPGIELLRAATAEASHKLFYAPHGLDLLEHQFYGDRALHTPVRILSVGRLVEKKGFGVLLEALGLLQASGLAFSLTIIGEGPLRGELQRQIPDGVEVQFQGQASSEQVYEAMCQADLLVMPSLQARDGDRDGLPNVLLEAAACGLPIVSTQAGAITDFLDESCSRLCHAGNAHSLADAITAAVIDYGESLHRSHIARARVAQNFDIEENIEILAQAFRTASVNSE